MVDVIFLFDFPQPIFRNPEDFAAYHWMPGKLFSPQRHD